jgi:hypothetical protein
MEDATDDQASASDEAFDPTRRKLCADGSCVGVLGDDGVCRVCGRTEAQAAAGEEVPEIRGLGQGPGEARHEGRGEGAEAGDGGGFDSSRRLCDDGSCVGVVGDDGVCRVCGRRAQ